MSNTEPTTMPESTAAEKGEVLTGTQASSISGPEVEKTAPSDVENGPPSGEANPAGPTFPDGGTEAWLVVAGVWCTSFCSFGWLSSIGAFQQYYQNDLLSDYSPSTVAWILSLQIFFMMGMGPIVGLLCDRYGPRGLLLAGSLLHVFGIMMASLATEYYQILLAQGVVSGIGNSAIFQPAMTCIFGYFNKRRAMAFGILTTGSSVGGIIFPIMVNRLIDQVGYGWAMRICAFLILALLTFANLTVRSRFPPRPQNLTLQQMKRPFTEMNFVFVSLGFFFFTFGFFATLNFLPVQALESGMDPNIVQYILTFVNAGSLVGRLFSGFLGDKIGGYNTFIIVCYLTGIFILGLWLPSPNDGAVIAFAVLFGFFSGAYVSLIAPLVGRISPPAEIGFRTGLVMFTMSVGGLITNPINGALLETPDRFTSMMVFSGVTCLFGTTFIVAARVKQVGFNPRIVF